MLYYRIYYELFFGKKYWLTIDFLAIHHLPDDLDILI